MGNKGKEGIANVCKIKKRLDDWQNVKGEDL